MANKSCGFSVPDDKELIPQESYERLSALMSLIKDVISDGALFEFCMSGKHLEWENPYITFIERSKRGDFDNVSDEDYREIRLYYKDIGASLWDKSSHIKCDYQPELTALLHSLCDAFTHCHHLTYGKEAQALCNDIHCEVDIPEMDA